MTSRQKVMLVAAQYGLKARQMTVEGDMLAKLAGLLTEERAKEVFEELQKLGLIDGEGLLTDNAKLDVLMGKKTEGVS